MNARESAYIYARAGCVIYIYTCRERWCVFLAKVDREGTRCFYAVYIKLYEGFWNVCSARSDDHGGALSVCVYKYRGNSKLGYLYMRDFHNRSCEGRAGGKLGLDIMKLIS